MATLSKPQYNFLRDWIAELPGVSEAPHRFGGTEFLVDGLEFMHFHGPSYLDIRLSKEDRERVLERGGAQEHRAPKHAQAGWVTFMIRSEDDIPTAKEIIQLAYSNAKRVMDTHIARRAKAILSSNKTSR